MSRFAMYRDAYNKLGAWSLAKRVYNELNDDGIFTWAAALAYSWMFALFPLIIFLLTLIAFLPLNTDRLVSEANGFISSSLPGEASKILTDQVSHILKNQQGGLLTIGALLTLWAASGGMASTMSALNRCYDIIEDQPFYIARPKAVLLTLVVLVLVLGVLVLLPVGGLILAFIKSNVRELSAPVEWGIDLLRWAMALGMMFLTVATIYYFGPRIGKGGGHFRFITPGGIFTVAVWILLGIAFRFYIDHFGKSYGQTYGAVGGVVILLLFLYLASLVLLVGAEVNSEFDFAMYGRTGGTAPKPGERPQVSKEANDASPHGPGATGTAASTDDRGLPPLPPPAPKPKPNPLLLATLTAATGVLAGMLLKPQKPIYHTKLTPKRKLKKVYPLTYAALKLPAR